jgi:DNA-directed RNA polymerase subunit beta'
VAESLDKLKDLGFEFATRSGLTISISDVRTPASKAALLEKFEAEADKVEGQYDRGVITDDERRQKEIEVWSEATARVRDAMQAEMRQEKFNPIDMMVGSGARGNVMQVQQIAGMRGLVANPRGEIIPRPIKSNFREGLSVLEYFISTHGARKGLADTALRTADSGYLTRRLVDVAQDVIVRLDDCKTRAFLEMPLYRDDGRVNDNLLGRIAAQKFATKRGRELLKKNDLISRELLAELAEAFPAGDTAESPTVPVRSVAKCEAEAGVCRACYGVSLATGVPADLGDAVGIVAAQSIGEPGTQLTMRTFHTGGVAGADITHGLPRVVELFEARKPKGVAEIARQSGKVAIERDEKSQKVIILDAKGEEHAYTLPRRTHLLVSHGEAIEVGHQLNEGSLYPAELLEVRGRDETERYLVAEVQQVYKSQGVDINDKHIELIVRQMLKRVRIDRKGDADFLPGSLVDRTALKRRNEEVKKAGGETATGEEVILGITKASLATDSFLSAASFQETTKVLTDAALEGKIDRLLGLKENVIIGKLIPAATGLKHYRQLEIEPTEPVQRPTADEIGLLDEDQLAAELGLEAEGLEGLGAEISTTDFGDDFGADFDLAEGGDGRTPAASDGSEES